MLNKMITGMRALLIVLICLVCLGCVSNKGKPLANAELNIDHPGIHNEFLKDSTFKNETNVGTDNKGAVIAENVVINVIKENPATWILKTSFEAGKQIWKHWKESRSEN